MNRSAVRVAKVGGSLFDLPDLAERLRCWIAAQSPAFHVLIAGGGSLADEVRTAARLHQLDHAPAHWICVDVLTATARMLAALLNRPEPLLSYASLREATQGGLDELHVFAPADFLRTAEATLPGAPLPHDWSATSDSIAARLAQALDAEELVLLKSIDVARDLSLEDAARDAVVDSFFPQAAQPLRAVRWVNLRSQLPADGLRLKTKNAE